MRFGGFLEMSQYFGKPMPSKGTAYNITAIMAAETAHDVDIRKAEVVPLSLDWLYFF